MRILNRITEKVEEQSLKDQLGRIVYLQKVRSKNNTESCVEMMKARNFFRLLKEKGIRKSDAEIASLKMFLAIDKNYPN